MIYFIVLGAAMLFQLRLFTLSPAVSEAGPFHLPQHAVGITPGPSPSRSGFQCPDRSRPARRVRRLQGRSEPRFGWPGIVLTSPFPLLMVAATYPFRRGLIRGHDVTPLVCAEARLLLCFAGLGISYFPYIIPPSNTTWQATAPASSQGFLLIGAVIPIILAYMAYSYWTFAAKFEPGAHH